jgi:hypothetical protein
MPWVNNRKILALWAINEPDNAWAWVTGLGWRKLDTTNTEKFVIEAANAKVGRSWVDVFEENRGGTFFIKEIYVWGAVQPPTGFEVTRSMSECIYGWTAAYRQEGAKVIVRIQLNPDANVTAAEVTACRQRWKTGIENEWNNRFSCCTNLTAVRESDCVAPSRISFEVRWVTSNAHHVVRVQRGPGRANMTRWFHDSSGDVAAHEFGHMIGNADEYRDAACPGRTPVNTGTIMDALPAGGPVERHVERICEAIGENAVPV